MLFKWLRGQCKHPESAIVAVTRPDESRQFKRLEWCRRCGALRYRWMANFCGDWWEMI